MFTPKYPAPDTAPPPLNTLVVQLVPEDEGRASAALAPTAQSQMPAPPARRTVQLTPASVVTVAAGGTAAALVVGTVLVSMLLAVAITAVSVAVCAVVLRSLLNNNR
ncbi:SpdD protein [Streptomyces caniferus]|uniref:SpdD protein n=1 Tax=Streptomyces caniferus TaxID=285557 RepID=A0ABZ1VL60_9ACTN|nr:SpdD protein [Streptomyces caniferus]